MLSKHPELWYTSQGEPRAMTKVGPKYFVFLVFINPGCATMNYTKSQGTKVTRSSETYIYGYRPDVNLHTKLMSSGAGKRNSKANELYVPTKTEDVLSILPKANLQVIRSNNFYTLLIVTVVKMSFPCPMTI